jgi:hypothetical protein
MDWRNAIDTGSRFIEGNISTLRRPVERERVSGVPRLTHDGPGRG